jgi:glycosyltransferase involved in cell wall biosynthesis
MAVALAESGWNVIYCEPWRAQECFRTPESDIERDFVGLRRMGGSLHLLRCPQWEAWQLLAIRQPEWVVFYNPFNGYLIPPGCRSHTIYEVVDDPSLDGRDQRWAEGHEKWVRTADIVTATAEAIHAQMVRARPDALLLPNGVRYEDWAVRGPSPVPSDMRAAREKSIIVGYYGAIAEWMDFDLWTAAARLRPDWAFVWIGFPYKPEITARIERAAALPNVFYLGKKMYRELPAYLGQFDVATIPFVLNPITHACSPLKLFEYLAAGKPVVATRMREILKYQSVGFAGTAEEFVAKVESALQRRNDPSYQRLLRAEAEANTWRARAAMLCRAMEEREQPTR